MERIRFIIITVPPPSIVRQLERFRIPAADVSGSRVALAYPPHVTLRTGALVPAAETAEYVEGLRDILEGFAPFPMRTIKLEASTYTEGDEEKHFVGYSIEESSDLMGLHERLLTYTPWMKREQPRFHPHLSIAYGDLTAAGADAVLRMVQQNPGIAPERLDWTCDNVGLYHRVSGEWQPFEIVTTVRV